METHCSVKGCDREVLCRALCELHYQRWRKWGDPTKTLLPRDRVCTAEDCREPHEAHGLCSKHYRRHRRSTESAYRESLKQSFRKWFIRPETKEKEARRNKNYYKKNLEACRKRSRDYSRKNREKVSERTRAYNQTHAGRFRSAGREAKRRNLCWNISLEFFVTNAALPCFYCGVYPSQCGGTWMDRVDCSQGYTESNVVPCCKSCNMFRSNLLTQEETVAAVALIKKLRGGRAWNQP